MLDIGSGKGAFVCDMASRGFLAYGVEVFDQYIELTKTRALEQGIHVDVRQGKGERIPFESGFFAFVNCAEVTEHVESPETLCREFYRVLRPGGYGYVSFHNRFGVYDFHYHLWGINWMPRRWAERVLRLLGKMRSDGSAGRQQLLTMHYYTYSQAVGMLQRVGFLVRDIREEKILQQYSGIVGTCLGLLYRTIAKHVYFNSFHLLVQKPTTPMQEDISITSAHLAP